MCSLRVIVSFFLLSQIQSQFLFCHTRIHKQYNVQRNAYYDHPWHKDKMYVIYINTNSLSLSLSFKHMQSLLLHLSSPRSLSISLRRLFLWVCFHLFFLSICRIYPSLLFSWRGEGVFVFFMSTHVPPLSLSLSHFPIFPSFYLETPRPHNMEIK